MKERKEKKRKEKKTITMMRAIAILLLLAILTVRTLADESAKGTRSKDEPDSNGELDLYCGPMDCYSLLGLERFQDITPRMLKSAYRRKALLYHPDKNPGANDKFLKLQTAVDTLSENKDDYDYYLRHPDRVAYNQMRYVRYYFAPKSDLRLVLLGGILAITAFKCMNQKRMHGRMVDAWKRLPETQKWALDEVMKQRKGKKVKKDAGRELLQKQINEFLDAKSKTHLNVQGGWRDPGLLDLFAVQVVCAPYWLFQAARDHVGLTLRRRRGTLTAADRSTLTRKALGISKLRWEVEDAVNSIDPERKQSSSKSSCGIRKIWKHGGAAERRNLLRTVGVGTSSIFGAKKETVGVTFPSNDSHLLVSWFIVYISKNPLSSNFLCC